MRIPTVSYSLNTTRSHRAKADKKILPTPQINPEIIGSKFELIYQQIKNIESRVESGQSLSIQELLSYQIKAAHFSLGIELVSKVAESASSTIRKLQSNQ